MTLDTPDRLASISAAFSGLMIALGSAVIRRPIGVLLVILGITYLALAIWRFIARRKPSEEP